MHLHAALITLLTVLLISFAMYLVGAARGKHQVHAPAITGHPDFDRTFRAHQNTLEQTVMFLPALWIACVYGNEQWAVWAGYAWLIGRVWYLLGYVREAGKRSKGFLIAGLAWIFIVGLALVGVVQKFLAA